MSRLLNISIDVTKIPREKIVQHDKGGKYVSLDIWIEDEPNQWGKDASVSIGQTKDERERKERKVYCGNGKKLYGWSKPAEQAPQRSSQKPTTADDDMDEIPF